MEIRDLESTYLVALAHALELLKVVIHLLLVALWIVSLMMLSVNVKKDTQVSQKRDNLINFYIISMIWASVSENNQ